MGTEEMSFKELGLKFYFVIKYGLEDVEDVSSDMSAAFASIREYVDEEESIAWVEEKEVLTTAPNMNLTKRNIFVLESFDGIAFEYLKDSKALVIGPRCMLSCLMEDASIPLGSSPVFTTAMRNLIICPSGLLNQDKENIRNLVQWMGGYYSDDLNNSCTHLVSNTVKSFKYEKAGENNIPIMQPDWVHDVWSRSKRGNILATSKEFDKYRLPIFYGLYITTSGLTNDKKNEVMNIVKDNGGHYTGLFKSSQTDVLITEKNKTDSQKYQAAARYKKDCLIPDWITDSLKKGYALPVIHYKISVMKVSTPTKLQKSVSAIDFNPDCTQLSEVSRLEDCRPNSTVNETLANISVASSIRSHAVKLVRAAYKDLLSQISTQQAKKAGPFLDGCCIYLAGFTADEKEKLNKILNVGSAIRYDEMNEKITHCIVGEPSTNELNKMNDHGVQILTLEWLAESIKCKLPVQEEKYGYQAKAVCAKIPEPPSPSSKKTIESMNHSFKKPALPKSRLDFTSTKPPSSKVLDMDQFEDEQNEFLSQYTPENAAPLPPKTTPDPEPIPTVASHLESDGQDSEMCTEDYNNLNFFVGYTVYVHDHENEEEVYQQLIDDCENAGAKLAEKNFKGVVDYAIVPSEQATDLSEVKVKAKNIINNLWIEDAIKANKVVDVSYYHEPIPTSADLQPLVGMIVVISIYSENERIFIEKLATILGATKQDTYARKQKPLLICPTAEGAKYNAAIKWHYPVVRSQWLVECAKKGEKVSLEPYLVGDSVLLTSGSWCATQSSSSTGSEKSACPDGKEDRKASSGNARGRLNETQLEDDVFHPPKSSPRKDRRSTGSLENAENILNPQRSPQKGCHDVENGPENSFIDDLANNRHQPNTPDGGTYLRHRRLSELAEPGRRNSRGSIGSPVTPPPAGDLNISDLVKEVSTPNRDLLYNVLKEMQSKETPESQRIRKLVATPGAQTKTPPTPKIPDFVLTPEVRKRRLAFLDSYYLPPTRTKKPSTPFSEIKKRFWKEALGDQYFEEGNYNTQTFSQIEDDAGPSAGIGPETQNAVETNIHVKRLSDFINNRDAEKQNHNEHHLPEIETESVPQKFDSEICGTEEMIGWRDPSEFSSESRTKAKHMKYQGTPRFTISCTNDSLKIKIMEQIKELNGEVCENLTTFDETCTHIVCERPNRGEKILSGIASGKWILEVKYIEESSEVGYFLDEELHEWGNPKATNLPNLTSSEQLIANGAFRWRKKLSESDGKTGVFHGFRVILHVSRKEQFQKLITAGGGVVLNVKEPYAESVEAMSATHCLVEQKKTKLTPKDHKALADAGILVLSVMYLNAHLTSEGQPDHTKYLLSL